MGVAVLPGNLRLGVSDAWRSTRPASDRKKLGMDTNSPEWRALRQKVMDRDDYRCVYCSFRARGYQIAHHIDGDPTHSVLENLVCICQACNSIVHCGRAGGLGEIELWQSPMTQAAIVQMCRETSRDKKYGLKDRRLGSALELTGEPVLVLGDGVVSSAREVEGTVAGGRYSRVYRSGSVCRYADLLVAHQNEEPEWGKNLRGVFTEKFDRWQLEYEF